MLLIRSKFSLVAIALAMRSMNCSALTVLLVYSHVRVNFESLDPRRIHVRAGSYYSGISMIIKASIYKDQEDFWCSCENGLVRSFFHLVSQAVLQPNNRTSPLSTHSVNPSVMPHYRMVSKNDSSPFQYNLLHTFIALSMKIH